jgi:hypothetical protein
MVSMKDNPSGQFSTGVFKASYIIPLPALQEDGYFCELLHGGFGIYAQGSVAFFCQGVCGLDLGFWGGHFRKSPVSH